MKNNQMKSAIIILILACIFALSIVPVAATGDESFPKLPVQFYGTLLDEKGQPFPAGTVLTAEVNDVISTFTLVEAGKIGGPGVFDPKFLVSGSPEKGDDIIFGVQDTTLKTLYIFMPLGSEVVEINLVIYTSGGSPDTEIINTLNKTNAVIEAKVGYKISPLNLSHLRAPIFARGVKSIVLNETVIVNKTVGGVETRVTPAKVNSDGTVDVNPKDIAGADYLTVTFIGRKIGDTIGNGRVDVSSNIKIARVLAGLAEMTEVDKFYGDINADGKLKVDDNIMLARYLAGILDENFEVI